MNDILKNISTMDEKGRLMGFLDKLSVRIFDPSVNVYELIDRELDGELGQGLKSFLGQTIENGQAEMILRQIHELKEKLDALPKITLTVAKIPDESQIKDVKSEFAEIDIPVIIDFKEDQDLIGGAVLEGNGYIFEHSFRDYFEKRRHAFLSENGTKKEVKHGL